jgi:hypothetical protein
VVALSGLSIALQETGLLGRLFPLVWFTLSMLAGVLTRQLGAIAFTWLSIPLYNSIVGQPNALSWATMLSLIVPIELFFLLTRYRLYTPLTMLLAVGLGMMGLWLVAELPTEQLLLTGAAVALGSLVAYVIGQWVDTFLA